MPCVSMHVHLTIAIRRGLAIGVVAGISALTLLLAGCGTSKPSGTLTGTFQIMVGGVEVRTVPGSGQVIVSQGTRRVAERRVHSGHVFRIGVPPGTYQISSTCTPLAGHGTPFSSTRKSVSVSASTATRADVQCLLDPGVG
jgi:hypothetical protein